MTDQVKVKSVETLSDDWYVLKKTTFEYQRLDGSWQTLARETYDRGNGAVILLYNLDNRSVILTRQFRYPTFVNGNVDGWMIEAAAGVLDDADPIDRIRAEVAEETGFAIENVSQVFEAYMSPGSVTERLYFFVAEYCAEDRQSDGGGNHSEGEDIEVLELKFSDALKMTEDRRICDAKTIMLLQYAALNLFR